MGASKATKVGSDPITPLARILWDSYSVYSTSVINHTQAVQLLHMQKINMV